MRTQSRFLGIQSANKTSRVHTAPEKPPKKGIYKLTGNSYNSCGLGRLSGLKLLLGRILSPSPTHSFLPTFHFRSRLWHRVRIPAEVDGFVIPSPTWLPRFVHVLILSLSLSSLSSLPLSDGLSRDGEQGLSRDLSFSLLFLLSPSATVSLATESTVSLSLPLFLSSLSSLPLSDGLSRDGESLSLPLFLSSLSSLPLSDGLSRDGEQGLSLSLSFSLLSSLPLSDGLSRDGEHGLSLSPSLSLFSFFSPPQRRSLSLPLFLSSLSSLPLSEGGMMEMLQLSSGYSSIDVPLSFSRTHCRVFLLQVVRLLFIRSVG